MAASGSNGDDGDNSVDVFAKPICGGTDLDGYEDDCDSGEESESNFDFSEKTSVFLNIYTFG